MVRSLEAWLVNSALTEVLDGGYVEYKLNLGESYFRCGIWVSGFESLLPLEIPDL